MVILMVTKFGVWNSQRFLPGISLVSVIAIENKRPICVNNRGFFDKLSLTDSTALARQLGFALIKLGWHSSLALALS
jgi:hypothetical protein